MEIWRAVFLAICLTSASSAAARAEAAPDIILVNGKIVTVDDRFSIQQAVAVQGDRFIAVGSNRELLPLAGPDTQIVDLEGKTVIPGLIDNHNHIIRATEYWSKEARLDGVTSRAQALAILKAKAGTLKTGEWMFTLGGWFEDQFSGDQSGFTLKELDAIAPDNPVFIQAMYDHAFVNSAWLEAMGLRIKALNKEAVAERGLAGDVVRDSGGTATGRLNGGFGMIGRAISRFPSVPENEQIPSIKAALTYLNSLGVTTVFDAGGLGIQEASYKRFQELADKGNLSVRIYYTLWGGVHIDTPQEAEAFAKKIEAERPFQGTVWYDRIAMGEVYYSPFHWDELTRFVSPTEEDYAAAHRILSAAAAGGWQVQTHSNHPSSMNALFDVMEEINKVHPLRALRWSITHADNVGPDEIARARALGMNLQIRSQRVIGGSAGAFEKFGGAVYHMPPLRLIQDSGISFGLGTDGTKAAQINPFVTLWWATTGKMLNGDILLKEVLSREEALIAHTRSNAILIFQEANLGSIKPGFLADLLVLDRDYLTIPLDQIKDIRPLATMVGGKIVSGEY